MGKEASILVRILGDAKSATDATDATTSAFEGMAGKLGKAGLAIGTAFAAAGIGAVVGLEKIGSSFDEAADSIAIKTGATGKVLDGLNDSFKNVVSNVPTDFGSASDAIGTINQQLGLTGKPLEDLSTQLLNLSRLTKTDVATNVKAATGAFNLWGVSAADQGTKLDELFRISQATGIGVGDLAQQMTDGGIQFQQAGLTFEQTGSLLGTLAKNGLSASDVLPALSKSMAQAAKDGVPAADAFKSIFTQIQNAPDDTTAAGLAFDTFGGKAGPKFAALIRSGALSFDDLAASISAGGNTINDTAKATDDWHEKLQVLMNKAMVKLAPLAEAVFNKIGDVVEAVSPYLERFATWLSEKIPPILADLRAWFEANWPAIRGAIEAVVNWLVGTAWPLLQSVFGYIVDAVDGVVHWFQTNWPAIQAAIATVVDWLVNTAWPAIQQVVQGISDAFGVLVGWIEEHWDRIKRVIDSAWTIIKTITEVEIAAIAASIYAVVEAVLWVWDHFGKQIVSSLKTAWDLVVSLVEAAVGVVEGIINAFADLFTGKWGKLWQDVKDIMSAVWDAIVALFRATVETITTLLSTAWEAIKIAAGLAWDGIKAAASAAWDLIKAAIMLPIHAAESLISSVWDSIKSAASTAWDGIKSAASSAWEAIKTAVMAPINAARDAISSVWDSVVSTITGLPSRIGSAASGMWNAIKDGFRSVLNTIIGWWNNLSFPSFKLPSLTIPMPPGIDDVTIGGMTFGGWQLPDIPTFHTGGIVPGQIGSERLALLQAGEGVFTREQMAALGGNGSTVNFMPGATIRNDVDIDAAFALLNFHLAAA